jgi:hypothetical protein
MYKTCVSVIEFAIDKQTCQGHGHPVLDDRDSESLLSQSHCAYFLKTKRKPTFLPLRLVSWRYFLLLGKAVMAHVLFGT